MKMYRLGMNQPNVTLTWMLTVAILLIAVVALLTGCGRLFRPSGPGPKPPSSNEKPVPTPSPEPTAQELTVYFTRDEYLGSAKRTVSIEHPIQVRATAAVAQLLTGPTDIEKEFGLGTTIPEGTTLNGVQINGTNAIVDFSPEYESGGGSLSMFLRIAQVVWTLTQFEEIDSVNFAIDGKVVDSIGDEGIIVSPAVTRKDFEDQAPKILVEYPAVNQEVKSPVAVSGSSNTFEAALMVDVVDPEGLILKTVPIMATSGTGTRGTFEESIPFKTTRSGLGAIIFYEVSPKDGKHINIIEIPIRMSK